MSLGVLSLLIINDRLQEIMMSKTNNVLQLSSQTWQQRLAADGYANPMKDPEWPDGVRIVDYDWYDPSLFTMHGLNQQSRQDGLDSSHLRTQQSYMEGRVQTHGSRAALKEPTFHTNHKITGQKNTEQGNHRHTAAINLGIPEIPSFEIELFARKDGLDPRKEFNEWHNNKNAPSKPHGEMEAIRLLEDHFQRGIFASDLKIKDPKKQEAAIRKRANDILRPNYARYTAQKRGGWITKWRNGCKPKSMRSWKNPDVWTHTNAWGLFSAIPTGSVHYDSLTNILQIVTQTHTSWAAAGLLAEKIKEIIKSLEAQGLSQPKIKKRVSSLKVEVMSYVDGSKLSSITDQQKLDAHRQMLLDSLRDYNNIPYLVPYQFTKVMFMPQCLQPAEPLQAIIYNWCSVNKRFL